MLKIEIKIERPFTMIAILAGTIGVFALLQAAVGKPAVRADVAGGQVSQERVTQNEQEIKRQRIEQAVLERQEEILRYQLRLIERAVEEQGMRWSEEQLLEWRRAREELIALLSDRALAEQKIKRALYELWEAEGELQTAALHTRGLLELSWPVESTRELTALYLDPAYEETFGLPHYGIDIPVEQRTVVRAAADGIVESVIDNGMGFSYLILRHEGGATLYGHLRGFLVHEGDQVREGSGIGLSGGMPGTRGAGSLSTGPHLHFEVFRNGMHVDPELYLPRR